MATLPTVARQIRRVVRELDRNVVYEVTTEITSPGDLPFNDVFVLTIADAANAKTDTLARIATPQDFWQAAPTGPLYIKVSSDDLIRISGDSFARVGNVNDITALPRDRTQAVRAGKTEYLTSVLTLLYDNVTTANAAYTQLLARLSDLVNTWRSTQTTFATNPDVTYSLPQTDSSVEAQLIAVYKADKAARVKAEATRDSAQAAKDACLTDCQGDKDIYTFLVADVAFLEAAKARVQGMNETATTSLVLTGGTTLTSPGTYTINATVSNTVKTYVLNGSEPTSYETLLVSKRAMRDQYYTKVVNCNANCIQLSANLLAAQQAVDAARAAENGALAAVLQVCPTFDSTSV